MPGAIWKVTQNLRFLRFRIVIVTLVLVCVTVMLMFDIAYSTLPNHLYKYIKPITNNIATTGSRKYHPFDKLSFDMPSLPQNRTEESWFLAAQTRQILQVINFSP